MNNGFRSLVCFFLLVGTSGHAAEPGGGVTIGGTRLVYEGAKKEASLNITNSSSSPYLIQSWIEPLAGGVEKSPFIITPPLFRLDGNKQNLLRIVRTGGNLSEDRESMYWLNIKSIPSSENKDGTNALQIAIKTSIKLIYRPQGLKDSPEALSDKLSWSQSGNRLSVNNPTPYYMNFGQVKVGGREVKDVTFVVPMSSATFTVPVGVSGSVNWKVINDYGGLGEEHVSGH